MSDQQDIIGFQAQGIVVCTLCGMRRDKGGYVVREPMGAAGPYCSAAHARIAVDEALGKDGDGDAS